MHGLGSERIGPVFSPSMHGAQRLVHQPPEALLEHALLHTRSRPQAWPTWATLNDLDPAALRQGTGFEHLYYLLEAAVAGLGFATPPGNAEGIRQASHDGPPAERVDTRDADLSR